MAGHQQVSMPASKIKGHIAVILEREGYILDQKKVDDGSPQGVIEITLNYKGRENAIHGLKRVSRPGRRAYSRARDLPRIRNGLGIAILSTSQGVISDREARERRIGGEVLCHVW